MIDYLARSAAFTALAFLAANGGHTIFAWSLLITAIGNIAVYLYEFVSREPTR
jgi:hypothetical protein